MILRRDTFQALADPTRRSILILLASQTLTAGEIADQFDSARSTVSKHIQILTACDLIKAQHQGREIYYELKMDNIQEIDLWLEELRSIWSSRFDKMEKYVKQLKKR